ncbi:endolytic transglycosylase MltG [Vibrio penaeicida]|uniref:Endolytic murein transglycosylase n=1 Tax=Vibrio penaeicida TaxID=104609 RepID=A0AAV5NM63_9VIBR|nr:endolytic transglycosylase MltG [Vibrio penaeicida]RTZ24473.1 endolytic transglycosylase MltG [Vibrio penaeicida]GLQ71756.1 aminodeoxychorismate lyase [Vibrio penaeicida]
MIKKIAIFLALCAVILAAVAFYVSQQAQQYINQPVTNSQPELITIKSGTSFQGVLAQFENSGWISTSPFSKLIRHAYPELVQVKAGTFLLKPEMTLSEALIFLGEGKEHQFAITFVEGTTFKEWRAILDTTEHLRHLTRGKSEPEIAEALNIDKQKLEGLFLAETYHFTAGTSDLDILKRAHRDLNTALNNAWQGKQEKLPLKSTYEALILASIIEKETALDEERERVSSVFINRLNKGMRLQTDPTVIYGMGENYDGNIRKKDLRTPTPYNTYVIKGLPPTPIAMAGPASIEAALNPENSRYLYFVASGHGGHVFSKNLAAHNRAVRQYLKVLRSKK